MAWIFWLSSAFIAYSLIGYPILLSIVAAIRPRISRRGSIWPTVSVIIVAHNEAALIGEKIKSTFEVDYPSDKFEIVVGSDGSTDATEETVRAFTASGVKLIASKERRGKHYIQMLARDASHGEILIFTDASIRTYPDVVQRLVSHFADPSVGSVSSADEVSGPRTGWVGEHFYVSGEMGLRKLESRISSVVSMSGSLYAVRREVCEDWHPDMSSDFFVALHTVERGLRAILDPECTVQVGVVRSEKREFSRKVRTIVHGMVILFSHLQLLNPFRHGFFAWQLLSHKLFRWLLPFAFLGLLTSNVFLWDYGTFYRTCLFAQTAIYGAGLLTFLGVPLSRWSIFRITSYFVMGNAATLVAWWKSCSGDKMVVWEPSRRA